MEIRKHATAHVSKLKNPQSIEQSEESGDESGENRDRDKNDNARIARPQNRVDRQNTRPVRARKLPARLQDFVLE